MGLPAGMEGLGLLRDVCADLKGGDDNGGHGSLEAWRALQLLCPDATTGAAEILDRKVVTRVFSSTSKREYFLVEGSGAARSPHVVVPGFCTCQFYCQHVATKPDSLACKHEIAVLAATALGLLQWRELDDDEWAREFDAAITYPMVSQYPAPASTT